MKIIEHSGKTDIVTGAGGGISTSAEAFADCGALLSVESPRRDDVTLSVIGILSIEQRGK